VSDRIAWGTEVANKVGKLLMSSFRTGVGTESKARGVITALDREAESLIVDELRAAFPGDGIIAEEGNELEGQNDWRWVVDPLDGTTNYVAGLPFFGVSLACMQQDAVRLGVVHAPALHETFSVTPDGAWDAEAPIQVSRTADLGDAVLLLNKAYHPATTLWGVTGELLGHLRAFRMLGCVSLELAYVAAGRADGIVLLPADPWDLAAAVAMLGASGADVVDLSGWPPKPGEPSGIVAAGPRLIEQILKYVQPQRMEHEA
jgi:myo-inositol-1(or 4)-monophosphatase